MACRPIAVEALRRADGLDYARVLPGISRRVKRSNPHRSVPRLRRVLAAAIAAGVTACGGSPTESEPGRAGPSGEFSGALAWADLEALARGPRALGADGAEAARSLITARLAASGIAVETLSTTAESKGFGPLALTHLVATLPGASTDRIVLVAPYDSGLYDGFTFVGANDGASGAAVLLEVARVLAGRALPYTVELVWLEGEGRIGRGEGEEREQRWLGSRSLAQRWGEKGHLSGIRLLVSFNRVCDADLQIARDSGSDREHREEFWRAARRLGFSDAFPPDRRYESVVSSQEAFRDRGVRPVVAIEDTAFGGGEAPGRYAGKEDVLAHCAPESLEVVGRVAVEAVATIATRLAKIDRFARMPSVEPATQPEASPREVREVPPPAPAPEPAAAASPPNAASSEAPDAAGNL
jgi:glutaminyl-peptide cyclotransferase